MATTADRHVELVELLARIFDDANEHIIPHAGKGLLGRLHGYALATGYMAGAFRAAIRRYGRRRVLAAYRDLLLGYAFDRLLVAGVNSVAAQAQGREP